MSTLPTLVRAATYRPLSLMQTIVAELLGLGLPADEVAVELKITVEGVRHHVKAAAAKIPGDLPAQTKVVAWARGATADVLEGTSLRGVVRRRSHSGRVVQVAGTS